MSIKEDGLFAVSGTIINAGSLGGIGELRVEAWDRDLICDDLLGSAVTNQDGRFRIRFSKDYFQELFVDRRPDLFFKVFDGETLIKSTQDDVLWNMEEGDHSVVIKVDLPAGADSGAVAAARIAVSGLLLNKENGYPLAGLTVRIFSVQTFEQSGPIDPEHGSPLAECMTGHRGRFSFDPADLEPCVAGFVLVCIDSKGSVVFTSPGYALSEPVENLILRVPMQTPLVNAALWQVVAGRAAQSRVVQLHELVRRLCRADSGDSLFSDLDMGQRLAIIGELECAFLDPAGVLRAHGPAPAFNDLNSPALLDGYLAQFKPFSADPDVKKAIDGLICKLDAFSSLWEVDWVMDIDALNDGDTGSAVNKFSDIYMSPVIDGLAAEFDPVPDFHLQIPTQLSRYRDYLRTIFTGQKDTDTYSHNKNNLERRFHQDFETLDTQARPANAIVIDILMRILSSMPGEYYGFGMLPGTIDAQGAQSHREYLDYLITKTGLPAAELGLRYRIDFERPDSVMSSEVQENIATLQRFYSDGFQSVADPFPIIPEQLMGKAPFFLYYEEWVEQNKPFHPENYLDHRRLFILFPDDSAREKARREAETKANSDSTFYTENYHNGWAWFGWLMALQDKLEAAHKSYEQAEYTIAYNLYGQAKSLAKEVVFLHGMPIDASHWHDNVNYDDFCKYCLGSLEYYEEYAMDGIEDMAHFFTSPKVVSPQDAVDWFKDSRLFNKWLTDRWKSLYLSAVRCYVHDLPLCLADTALALGNYRQASEYYSSAGSFSIAKAKEGDSGYLSRGDYYWEEDRNVEINSDSDSIHMFIDGQTPYSVYKEETPETGWIKSIITLCVSHFNPAVVRSCRLHHGAALLEWADALYRSDEAPGIQRARELYKAVLFLHRRKPPIDPAWPDQLGVFYIKQHSENPALTQQTTHALKGYYQIEAKLNYLGACDDMVPTLHYGTLKRAADRFAESAKAAQQDFLLYTANLESLLEASIRERLTTANALKKAALLGEIAGEQAAIAAHGVAQAEQQVADVLAAIQAKQDELDDSDSFLNQVKDFGKGFSDALGGLGQDPKATYGAFMAGSAGGVMAGYGLFIYGSYTSLSGMADLYNSRKGDLNTLKTRTLPAAQAMVKVREREVNIARLQQQIALSDAQFAMALAKEIQNFQENRFLNTEFWAKLAALMKRVMRRYIELGVRYAWLAERALAYEQDRTVNIIRFDYFPVSLQGVTGADLLKLDLAELEASRLDNIKLTLPVKKTCSLAFDYPLQFAQLKKTGQCSFFTRELAFRQMYPGFYGYRIHAVDIRVQQTGAVPRAAGLLKNDGISSVSRMDSEQYVLRREPCAFPLSGFQTGDDPSLYGLSGDALAAFEGSGIETAWTLEMPGAANPQGVKKMSDVLITFHMQAYYSPELYLRHISEKAASARRLRLFSARSLAPDMLEALRQGAGTATFPFDLQAVGLPENETQREIKNLIFFLAAKDESEIRAAIKSTMLQNPVGFSFHQGVAMSNLGPLHSSTVTSGLDQFKDQDAAQQFDITINAADNPGVDLTRITDLVLGVEYLAHY